MITCREFAELATEHLEGTLGALERAVDDHLAGCLGCRTYVRQLRQTVDLLGAVGPEEISPDLMGSLLRQFARPADGWAVADTVDRLSRGTARRVTGR